MSLTRCLFMQLLLVAIVPRSHAIQLVPGFKEAIYGDVVGHSDLELNLRPPEETVQIMQDSLYSIETLEDERRIASEKDFAVDIQNLINVEKMTVRRIVADAFSLFAVRVNAVVE